MKDVYSAPKPTPPQMPEVIGSGVVWVWRAIVKLWQHAIVRPCAYSLLALVALCGIYGIMERGFVHFCPEFGQRITIFSPMIRPGNILIPDGAKKIDRYIGRNILGWDRGQGQSRRNIGNQHHVHSFLLWVMNRNIISAISNTGKKTGNNAWHFANIDRFYVRYEITGFLREIVVLNLDINPSSFVIYSCSSHFIQLPLQNLQLPFGISLLNQVSGLRGLEFSIHRLPLFIKGAPFKNGNDGINGNENNFDNVQTKIPFFASIGSLVFGIIGLSIGAINFNQRRNERLYLAIFCLGCVLLYSGLFGIAFWADTIDVFSTTD